MNKKWFFAGLIMGFILLLLFITALPDGRTFTLVFCSVGQGDAAYLRFPDGRDMLIDGGPDGSVLSCLGKFMPFWDRQLDVVIITHPEKDHFYGIIEVLKRYSIGTVIHTGVVNDTQEYKQFRALLDAKKTSVRNLFAGDSLLIGAVLFRWLWPSRAYISDVLGIQSQEESGRFVEQVINKNDTSQVIHVTYKSFDALFTGDAGIQVDASYTGLPISPDPIEVLKVPHHGSATGMSDQFLLWLKPVYGVISSGKKNRYGHPSSAAIELLKKYGVHILRTDEQGSIVVQTDGNNTKVTNNFRKLF